MKRGQATLFIIVGLVIVLLLFIIIFFQDSISKITNLGSLSYPSEVQEVADYNEQCINTLAKEAIIELALKSGQYHIRDEDAYNFLGELIPYGYYAGENKLISIEAYEANIEEYLQDKIVTNCYDNNPYSEEFNLTIREGDTKTTIEENLVDFIVTFPMTVESADKSYNLKEDYKFSVNARVGFVYETAMRVVNSSVEDPSSFDYQQILTEGLNIQLQDVEDETTIFIIEDPSSLDTGAGAVGRQAPSTRSVTMGVPLLRASSITPA